MVETYSILLVLLSEIFEIKVFEDTGRAVLYELGFDFGKIIHVVK